MNKFLQIITGTPLYVWAILIYVLFVGIKSIKSRIVFLPKLFIIPIVLLAIKYKAFFSKDAVVFCFAILLGVIVSFFIHAKNKIKIIKKAQSIEMPGTYITLALLISFFLVKYCFGFLKATNPELYIEYSFFDNAISGLLSGYFMGRALGYTYKYFKE